MANPETEIVRQILDYLEGKHIFHWRQNNTGKMPGGRYVSVKRGIPDIFAVMRQHFFAIEVKTPTGKLSSDQADFAVQWVKNGGEFIVARSVDDVIAAGL